MRRGHLLFDGLWRCLCPSVSRKSLRRAIDAPLPMPREALRRPTKQQRCLMSPTLVHTRSYGTDALDCGVTRSSAGVGAAPQATPEKKLSRGSTLEERILAPTPPTEDTLLSTPEEDIVNCLISIRDPKGWSIHGSDIDRHARILQLVTHIVRARGRAVNPFVYECMMDAMADPEGSVHGIRRLLHDMAEGGMKPTAAICRAALDALMIHPDYMLRQEMLDTMQEYWFAIDMRVRQAVVVGLLRDEQYELAHARLTELLEQGARIEPWVYDVFVLVYGQLGFLDEMLQLLYRRRAEKANDTASSLVFYALDVCSRAFHYEGTAYAWNAVVRSSLLRPSDGVVEGVLGTAARHGDAQLATEALHMLSSRTRVQGHHYEAAAEAFARGGDVAAALRTLCIMTQSGHFVSRSSTRALCQVMKRDPSLVGAASSALHQLSRSQDGPLPAAAVAAVLEGQAATHGSEAALPLFESISPLTGHPPTADVVQDMIIYGRDRSTRRSMVELYGTTFAEGEDDMTGGRESCGALIEACVEAGHLDLAFRFVAQMFRLGPSARHLGWARRLVDKAVEMQDGRVWAVVDRLEGLDGDVFGEVCRVLRRRRIEQRTEEIRGRTA